MVGGCLLALACSDDDTATSPTSTEFAGTVWTYDDLDGEPVTIRDDGGATGFEGDVPTAVAVIDEAVARNSCRDLRFELDLWLDLADSPGGAGDRASAYANYALSRGAAMGCGFDRP